MNLQESGEMYLETILVLSKKNKDVRSIDIEENLIIPNRVFLVLLVY